MIIMMVYYLDRINKARGILPDMDDLEIIYWFLETD